MSSGSSGAPSVLPPVPPDGDRGDNLGCGVGLLAGGGLLFAQQAGWIRAGDWLLPCVLLGLGVSYIYKALRRPR